MNAHTRLASHQALAFHDMIDALGWASGVLYHGAMLMSITCKYCHNLTRSANWAQSDYKYGLNVLHLR